MYKNIFKNLIAIVIGVFIFFIIGEIYFRFINPQDNMEFVGDKKLYWIAKPNQKSRILMGNGSHWSPLTTVNSMGLRGDEITIKPNEKRILFLGDSFTFGEGVGDDETTPSWFLKILNKNNINGYRIINGGMRGWGVFQMQRLFYNNFNKFDPNIVVLIYKESDELRQPFKTDLEVEQYLKKHRFQRQIRKISKFVTWIYRKIVVIKLQRQHKGAENYISEADALEREKLISTDIIRLHSINEFCKKNNTYFLLVGWLEGNQSEMFKKKLEEISEIDNIPLLLTGDSLFPKKYSTNDLKIVNDGHPTALAHKINAQMIFDKIKQLNWLDETSFTKGN